MTEAEFSAEYIRKSFRPSFIFRLPSDENKCYHFTAVGSGKGIRFKCVGCSSGEKKAPKNEEHQKIKHRKVNGLYMREDPEMYHTSFCEPWLYSLVMQKLVVVENTEKNRMKQSGFPIIKVQQYTYSVLYKLPNDPSKCYRFRKSINRLLTKSVVCATCALYHSSLAEHRKYSFCSSGFIDNPTVGHHEKCRPICHDELMREYELTDEETAKQYMLERQRFATVTPRHTDTSKNLQADDASISNGCQIQVIEARQKITYFYRIPGDETKSYRFFEFAQSNSRRSLHCYTCHNLRHDRRKIRRNDILKSYESDGHHMLEDPTLDHFPECKAHLYAKETESYRLLDDKHDTLMGKGQFNTSVSVWIGAYSLERRSKIGKLQILFVLENDSTKCYRFNFQPAGNVFCTKCRRIQEKNKTLYKPGYYRFTRSGFMDDPLLNHLPGCEPQLKIIILKQFQLVEGEEARKFLQLRNESSECDTSTFHIPSTDDLISSSTAAFPIYFLSSRMKTKSYIYRLKDDMNKCYRFLLFNGNGNFMMKCAYCYKRYKGASTVISRETDVCSMMLDPCLDHLPGCEPQQYQHVLKTHQHVNKELQDAPRYDYLLEQVELRQHFNAIYILKDKTKCYRFNMRTIKLKRKPRFERLLVSCIGCHKVTYGTKKLKNTEKEFPSTYRCTIDGFLTDPSLNHVSRCEPFLYSDVMTEFHLTQHAIAAQYFKYAGENGRPANDIQNKNCNTPSADQFLMTSNGISRAPYGEGQNSIEKATEHVIPNNTTIIIKSKIIKTEELNKLPKKIKRERPFFSHTFEISFFTEDETELRVEGRTLFVQCARKSYYPKDMKVGAKFTVCANADESPHCSDGNAVDANFHDHMWYFEVNVMDYRSQGCK